MAEGERESGDPGGAEDVDGIANLRVEAAGDEGCRFGRYRERPAELDSRRHPEGERDCREKQAQYSKERERLLQTISHEIGGARSRRGDLGRGYRFPIQVDGFSSNRVASLSSYPPRGAGNSLVD
jgi:hypothetical protein